MYKTHTNGEYNFRAMTATVRAADECLQSRSGSGIIGDPRI